MGLGQRSYVAQLERLLDTGAFDAVVHLEGAVVHLILQRSFEALP